MPSDEEQASERSHLLPNVANDRRLSVMRQEDAYSVLSSHLSKEERALSSTPVGERLPYNDYTTIDWLHDLVREQSLFEAKAHGTRSKTRSDSVLSIRAEESATTYSLPGTRVKDG